jgi:type IV pilus assembly protein PilO
MAKKEGALKLSLPKINFDLDTVKEQFQGLNGRHPGLWPVVPRIAALLGLTALFCVLAYFLLWGGQLDEIDASRKKEEELKVQYQEKVRKAVNLAALLKQKEQVLQYVGQLEKQLPSKAEMDALLTEINNAGVGRGLQFELFKPNQVIVHDYYAELPIQIKLVGAYHDMGAFTSDISNLSRIVTLNDMKIDAFDKGGLSMEATAKTFRYLDAAEIAQRRKEKDEAAKTAGAPK